VTPRALATVILNDIRSAYNVGSILRTADAVGDIDVVCCGITPHPAVPGDPRSPVVIDANTRAIAKTALGAQQAVPIGYERDPLSAVATARRAGQTIVALELSPGAGDLFAFSPDARSNYALLLGGEVDGLSPDQLATADHVLQIPQRGVKESLNVAVAAGVAMYHLFRQR
jgi:tRNA G18 (ribose-2'-O)-methylase SpoU